MKNKSVIALILTFALCFTSVCPAFAAESIAVKPGGMSWSESGSVQTTPKPAPSWKKDGNGWWYDRGDGTYPAGKFETIGGKTYYFNKSGYMVTDWQQIGGKWYYFDGNGAMKTGWQ